MGVRLTLSDPSWFGFSHLPFTAQHLHAQPRQSVGLALAAVRRQASEDVDSGFGEVNVILSAAGAVVSTDAKDTGGWWFSQTNSHPIRGGSAAQASSIGIAHPQEASTRNVGVWPNSNDGWVGASVDAFSHP